MAGEDFVAALEEANQSAHEYRIYIDDYAEDYVIVDEIDYQWAIQWRWAKKRSRGLAGFYAYRTTGGRRKGQRAEGKRSIYLHVEIQERKKIKRPSGFDVCDHRDGDTSNCRRNNLRYATASMNRKNRNGRDSGVYDDEEAYYQSLIKKPPKRKERKRDVQL